MKWLKSFTAVFMLVAGIVFITNFTLSMNQEDMVIQTQPSTNTELAPPPIQEDIEEPVPKEGGSIKLCTRKPETLNPLLNTDKDVDKALRLMFDPLFALDENQKPQPVIVDRYDKSDNAESITLILNRDIKWHDGTPLTARDVVFSLNFINSAEKSFYKEMIKNIRDYTWTDDFTVKINFYSAEALSEYSLMFPVIPEAYYKKEQDLKSTKNFNPVGSGAYKFVEYNQFNEINLIANEDYYKSKPFITNITLIPSSDIETDTLLYYELLVDAVNTTYSDWVKYSAIRNTEKKTYISNLYDFCGFNMDSEIVSNINVRKAIAHLIPYEEIFNKTYSSHAVKATGMVNPEHWMYEADVNVHDYSKVLASSFLELCDLTNMKFTILVNNENQQRIDIANMICESLNAGGIDATIDAVDYNKYVEKLQNGEFDMFLGCIDLYSKPQFALEFTKFNDPEYLDLLYSYKNALTEEKAVLYAKKLQSYLAAKIPYIGIAYREGALLVDEKIVCTLKATLDNGFNDINDWYIK